jgi:hypothetical protein
MNENIAARILAVPLRDINSRNRSELALADRAPTLPSWANRAAAFGKAAPARVAAFLFLLAVGLVFRNFDIGFRTTADQIQDSHYVFTHSMSEILSRDIAAARDQGRIGHLLVLPLTSLGSYIGDAVFYPALCVGIFVALAYSMFLWVELIAVARVAVPLTAAYLALLPVGLHHWLPNAFSMFFLPLALGLVARNLLLARPGLRTPQRLALLLVVLLAALSYEMAFAILVAMTVTDAVATHAGPARYRARGLNQRFVLEQAVVLGISLLATLGFRQVFPSSYEGNQPTDAAMLGAVAETALRHLASGSSVDLIWERWSQQTFSPGTIVHATLVAVGLGAGAARLAWPERRQALVLAMGGLLIAAIVTLAVGSVGKYIDWCLRFKECRYIDSRFALGGLIIAGVAFAVLSLGDRGARLLLVVVVASAGFLSTAFNIGERPKLDFGRRAEDIAKRVVCENGEALANVRTVAERLAELPVSFHPEYTFASKSQYWGAYISHLRSTSLWRCP